MPRALPLLALLILQHAAAALAQAPTLEILTYPHAGVFESAAGHPGGAGGAMLRRMEAVSGVTLHQQLMPIPRALATMEQKPGHCAVALPRTPEREAALLWAGPWARGAIAVYGRPDETRKVTGAQDLRGRRLVVLRDSSPAAWLKEQGLQAEAVKDNVTALRMLQARRVDYWLANDLAAYFVVHTEGGSVPRQLYSTGRIDLYIACHPASDPAAVSALDAAIAQLRRGGELAEFGMR